MWQEKIFFVAARVEGTHKHGTFLKSVDPIGQKKGVIETAAA